MALNIIVLAAGQGTRMYSDIPKVLHRLAGRPLLTHVIEVTRSFQAQATYVVYGHGGEQVPTALEGLEVRWVKQEPQLGTGHAVELVLPAIAADDTVLIMYGDVPLIESQTLDRLIATVSYTTVGLLTVELNDPTGYGRIVRNAEGRVTRIVEQQDTSPQEQAIREVNTGVMAVRADALRDWLTELDNRNAQGEFYLTDVIALAVQYGFAINTVSPGAVYEVLGVNNRRQLAHLERIYQRREAQRLMAQGTTLADPDRIEVRGDLRVGRDVYIDIDCIFEGEVQLSDGACIGPYTVIKDSKIGAQTEVLSHCVIDQADIGPHSRIGPFARLRPGTQLASSVHIGNYVEVKKSKVGEGSKINHLSYIGDTTMGRGVNIGAGTITCNYDGVNKHRTVIGDHAFIGSDTQLIAPVSVGNNATVGAGSTIVMDTPADQLTVSRVKQRTVPGWKRPSK